jgi:hypothetical protein
MTLTTLIIPINKVYKSKRVAAGRPRSKPDEGAVGCPQTVRTESCRHRGVSMSEKDKLSVGVCGVLFLPVPIFIGSSFFCTSKRNEQQDVKNKNVKPLTGFV